MNKPIEFDLLQRRHALDDWLAESKRRMGLRFPKIDFDSDEWPIRVLHQTEQPDWYFTQSMADFAEKDTSYRDALRCLVAEMVVAGKLKSFSDSVSAYRQLAPASPHRLFDLTLADLRRLEECLHVHAKENPKAANLMARRLSTLSKMMVRLSRKGVLPALGFHMHASTKAELRKIAVAHRAKLRDGKGDRLDRAMEALNDAFNRMVDGAPELSARDRVALCTGVLLLCAPSRINEILCMSIDDHVTVEDYAQKPAGELDATHRAHQMLIMTMKGSKGAEWSPKPVLSFMMDVFHYAMDLIKGHGKRSRMLVEWYQKHPDTLYLPTELEYLRGQAISRRDLQRIIQLDGNLPDDRPNATANIYFNELLGRQFKGPNLSHDQAKGRSRGHRPSIDYLHWADVETLLLNKVRAAMGRCRRVTSLNHYQGDLAKMLFLFDDNAVPFLPGTLTYESIKRCLKTVPNKRPHIAQQRSLFEKLKITMPVDNKIQIAAMDTHDPRRWLTTMALIHGERLSDVLINKWANRCKLSQLAAYDFRTTETMAGQASMPEARELVELADLSDGLATIETLEEQFGLQTAFVTAHDAGIAITTLDNVAEAVDNRPVARTSRGIIIIYPQRFGICLHQHHEKPCRNYSNDLSASCITCNEGVHVKGHIPTNDETRKLAEKLFKIIIRHLENLALTHNRNVADDPAALGEHMLTLIEKGLSPFLLQQLAAELIENFHVKQIGDRLKDRLLARRLEEAHAAMGVVKELDNSERPTGALIKYHNPARHSEPLLEIALDEHGGREQVERDEQALIAKYPQFAPKSVGLKDERHLIAPDDDEGED